MEMRNSTKSFALGGCVEPPVSAAPAPTSDEVGDLDALEKVARAATPGPWEEDTEDSEGSYGIGANTQEGFKAYVMLAEVIKGHPWVKLFDSLNSTASEVHEEYDIDHHYAWDDTARKNFKFVAAFNPRTALALIAELRLRRALSQPATDERAKAIGYPVQAIDFACDHEGGEAVTFLRDWREGDLSEWPDYIEWLQERDGPPTVPVAQPQPGTEGVRQWIVDLIRDKFDKAPSHWPARDSAASWIDGAEEIAAEIIARLSRPSPDAGVTDEQVERALHAIVPGGSKVWVWIAQISPWGPSDPARDVMRAALEAAALPSPGTDAVKIAVEVLEYYVNPHMWNQKYGEEGNTPDFYDETGCGDKAVAALERIRALTQKDQPEGENDV